MKDKISNDKTCKDCYYYLRHYTKLNNSFMQVFCGHCTNANIHKGGANTKNPDNPACKYWENNAEIKAMRKISIKDTLITMAEHIWQMLLILKDD